MIYTQVVSDPRLEAAVQKAFRVAGSRGTSSK